MRIGLTVANCINNDILENTNTIIHYIKEASKQNIDYIFFGESFLQGFESLNWDYEHDSKIAITKDDVTIQSIIDTIIQYKVGVGFGYFEKEQDTLYSSYLLLNKEGSIITNFQRVSKGWKHFRHTNHQYKEGNEVYQFKIEDHTFTLALCGDLWDQDTISMFQNEHVKESTILWPVHVDFNLEAWEIEKEEYHKQAISFSNKVLMINNIMKPSTHGGAFLFTKNNLKQLPFDQKGFLIIEL